MIKGLPEFEKRKSLKEWRSLSGIGNPQHKREDIV